MFICRVICQRTASARPCEYCSAEHHRRPHLFPLRRCGGLTWTPVDQSKTRSSPLATAGQRLDVAGITGPVAAYSVPANIGELTLTLSSEVNKQTSVFAPNVLILDQNMTPSAFFPSNYFTYQEPGVMSADRLEGVMRLTPALGQQKTLCFGLYH